MPRRDVVVIGASAGGLEALRRLVARLPADLPASVLVAVHLAPTAPSRLAEVLGKAGPLPAAPAVSGERMRHGRIYTAVPDRHLLIGADDVLQLGRGPRENRVRPAVDALLRAAARRCGPRVIGVVLSGSLDDGAAGLAAVAQRGGIGLVQQPDDAKFDGMPRAALQAVPEAMVLPAARLGQAIAKLVDEPVEPVDTGPDDGLVWETDMSAHGYSDSEQPGTPVGLGCPECSGGMQMVETGSALHYVCHAGHSYSPQTLLAARDDGIEQAVWTAISALQEKATVLRQLAHRADQVGDDAGHAHHHGAAQYALHAAGLLREQVMGERTGAAVGPGGAGGV